MRGGGVGGHGLIDFEIGHFEFAGEVEEERIFLRSKVALGLFVKGVEHVDEFAGGVGIDHGLAGTRVGIGAEDHGSVAAEHADEVFKGSGALGSIRSGFGCGGWSFGGRGRNFGGSGGFSSGFASFLFECFLAEFALGGEGAAVDYLETFVVLLVGQEIFLVWIFA